MIFPFSFRNGYGKDLWPRPCATVVLIVADGVIGVVVMVVAAVVDDEDDDEVEMDDTVAVVDFDGEFSPKILSMEKFN